MTDIELTQREVYSEEIWIKAYTEPPSVITLFDSSQSLLKIIPFSQKVSLLATDYNSGLTYNVESIQYLFLKSRWNYFLVQYSGNNTGKILRAQINDKEVGRLIVNLGFPANYQICWTPFNDTGLLLRHYRLWNRYLSAEETFHNAASASVRASSLLLHYAFNEHGYAHYDYSANTRHITYTSQKPVSDTSKDFMEIGEGEHSYHLLEFDPNSLGPHFPIPPRVFLKKEVTVEFWIFFKSTSETIVPILGIAGQVHYKGFEIAYDFLNAQLWCYFSHAINYSPTLKISFSPSLKKWNHIACVNSVSKNKAQIFINSVAELNSTFEDYDADASFDATKQFVLGKRISSMIATIPGYAQELRIWNEPLDSQKIHLFMHQRLDGMQHANLVLYYPLDENNGRMLNDNAYTIRAEIGPNSPYSSLYTSTSINFTWISSPLDWPLLTRCAPNSFFDNERSMCLKGGKKYLHFVERHDYSVSISFTSGLYTSFTIDCWMFPDNITGDTSIYAQSDFVELGFNQTTLFASFQTGTCTVSQNISVGTWNHLFFSYDHSAPSVLLGMNGKALKTCTTEIGAPAHPSYQTIIYIGGTGSKSFKGYMTNYRIWKSAYTHMAKIYKEQGRNNTDLRWKFKFDEGYGDCSREELDDSLFLNNGDLQWDFLPSEPPLCDHDCYFDGLSCKCDFRAPYSLFDSEGTIEVPNIPFSNVGNIEFWIYFTEKKLSVAFSQASPPNDCFKLDIIDALINIETSSVPCTTSYSFPGLHAWKHVSIKHEISTSGGTLASHSRLYFNLNYVINNVVPTSTCGVSFSNGILKVLNRNGFIRELRIARMSKYQISIHSTARYNPCFGRETTFCNQNTFFIYLPFNDTSGVTSFRNLAGTNSDYTPTLSTAHNSAFVWIPVEPLIVCPYKTIYSSTYDICQGQSPVPMIAKTFTVSDMQARPLSRMYCFWLYVNTDGVGATQNLLIFKERDDSRLISKFYYDSNKINFELQSVSKVGGTFYLVNPNLNSSISSFKWIHVTGEIQQDTGSPSLGYDFKIKMIDGEYRYPTYSSNEQTNTASLIYYYGASGTSITCEISACSPTSCDYYMHHLQIYSTSGLDISPHDPTYTSSLTFFIEFVDLEGAVKYNHYSISNIWDITGALLNYSIGLPDDNRTYFSSYSDNLETLQKSIYLLNVEKNKYQAVYVPLEGKIPDGGEWTVEGWIKDLDSNYTDTAKTSLFGIGNLVDVFVDFRIDKANNKYFVQSSLGGNTNLFSEISIPDTATYWHFCIMRLRNNSASTQVLSYIGFSYNFSLSATSVEQGFNDYGTTSKYKYVVFGENPLDSSSTNKGFYLKSFNVWGIALTEAQSKCHAKLLIPSFHNMTNLISSFEASLSTQDFGRDSGFQSSSLIWYKRWKEGRATDLVSYTKLLTKEYETDIDFCPLDYCSSQLAKCLRNDGLLKESLKSLQLNSEVSLELPLPTEALTYPDWSIEFWMKLMYWEGASVNILYQTNGEKSFILRREGTSETTLEFFPMRTTDIISIDLKKYTWGKISITNQKTENKLEFSIYPLGNYPYSEYTTGANCLNFSYNLKTNNATETGKTAVFYLKDFRIFNERFFYKSSSFFKNLQIDPDLMPSLITYYKLGEGEGTVLFDTVNSSRTGVIINNYCPSKLWHTELELRICPPNVMYNSDYNGCSNYFVKYAPSAGTGTIDYFIQKVDSITLQFWIYQVDSIANSTLIQAPVVHIAIREDKYTCDLGNSIISSTSPITNNSWEYVACSAGLKFGSLLYNSEFIECSSCTSNQTVVDTLKISRYDSSAFYLRQIQVWEGVKTKQEIIDSRNLYYYNYPSDLLMFSFYSDDGVPYNFATQKCNSAGTSTLTDTFELTFPSVITALVKNSKSPSVLLLESGEIELPLPTHIWHFIRKEFAFRVWIRLNGTLSDDIDLFSNSEVMSLRIFSDRKVGIHALVHRETKLNYTIPSSISIPDNQWALITAMKNSSDWFTFGLNNSFDEVFFAFNSSLNQSYAYSGFIRNPSGAQLHLRDYCLYINQFTSLEYNQFLNTRLNPKKFFKKSFIFYPFDEGTGTTVTNQDLNYVNKMQWGMVSNVVAGLPSSASWKIDSTFPKLCSMDQWLSPTGRCIQKGRSLFFSGSNTYSVSIPIQEVNNEYTYELWTYHHLPTLSKKSLIISFNGSKELYLNIDIINSKTAYEFYGNGLSGFNTAGVSNLEASSSASDADSVWIYVIVSNSVNRNESIMYSSIATSLSSLSSGVSFLSFGLNSANYVTLSSDSSSIAYEGVIKELRIYNEYQGIGPGISRMKNYLSPLFEPDLIHYWRLSENYGSILYDFGKNGNSTDISRSVSGKAAPLWVNTKEQLILLPPQSPLQEASYDYDISLSSNYSLEIPDFLQSKYTVHLWFKIFDSDTGAQAIGSPDFLISISNSSLTVKFSSADSNHTNIVTNDIWTFVHISMNSDTNQVNEYSTNLLGTTPIEFSDSGPNYSTSSTAINSISISVTGNFTGKLKTLALYSEYSNINSNNLALPLLYLEYNFPSWKYEKLHSYFDFSWRGAGYLLNKNFKGQKTALDTFQVSTSSYNSICSPSIISFSNSGNSSIINFEFSSNITLHKDFETSIPRQDYCYQVFTKNTCDTYFGRYYMCKLNGTKFQVYIGKGWHLNAGDELELAEGKLFASHCPYSILDSRAPYHSLFDPTKVLNYSIPSTTNYSAALTFQLEFPSYIPQCQDVNIEISNVYGLGYKTPIYFVYRCTAATPINSSSSNSIYTTNMNSINTLLTNVVNNATDLLYSITVPHSYFIAGTQYTFEVEIQNFLFVTEIRNASFIFKEDYYPEMNISITGISTTNATVTGVDLVPLEIQTYCRNAIYLSINPYTRNKCDAEIVKNFTFFNISISAIGNAPSFSVSSLTEFYISQYATTPNSTYEYYLTATLSSEPSRCAFKKIKIIVLQGKIEVQLRSSKQILWYSEASTIYGGEYTRDFDLPSNYSESLSFIWTCFDLSTNDNCIDSSTNSQFPPTSLSSKTTTLTIPKYTFAVGKNVRIGLIAKDTGERYSNQAYEILEYRNKSQEILTIRSNYQNNSRINLHDFLILGAEVKTSSASGTYYYSWTVEPILEKSSFSSVKEEGNIFENKFLEVRPYVLSPFIQYNFTCQSRSTLKSIDSRSFIISVNQPPENGSFSIFPQSGVEYKTNFNFIHNGWADQESDNPLQYSYMYRVLGESKNWYTIYDQFLKHHNLPSGLSSNNYQIEIMEIIRDSLGAKSNSTCIIYVGKSEDVNNVCNSVDTLLQSISLNYDNASAQNLSQIGACLRARSNSTLGSQFAINTSQFIYSVRNRDLSTMISESCIDTLNIIALYYGGNKWLLESLRAILSNQLQNIPAASEDPLENIKKDFGLSANHLEKAGNILNVILENNTKNSYIVENENDTVNEIIDLLGLHLVKTNYFKEKEESTLNFSNFMISAKKFSKIPSSSSLSVNLPQSHINFPLKNINQLQFPVSIVFAEIKTDIHRREYTNWNLRDNIIRISLFSETKKIALGTLNQALSISFVRAKSVLEDVVCKYYKKETQNYSTKGVTLVHFDGTTAICNATHLSDFTIFGKELPGKEWVITRLSLWIHCFLFILILGINCFAYAKDRLENKNLSTIQVINETEENSKGIIEISDLNNTNSPVILPHNLPRMKSKRSEPVSFYELAYIVFLRQHIFLGIFSYFHPSFSRKLRALLFSLRLAFIILVLYVLIYFIVGGTIFTAYSIIVVLISVPFTAFIKWLFKQLLAKNNNLPLSKQEKCCKCVFGIATIIFIASVLIFALFAIIIIETLGDLRMLRICSSLLVYSILYDFMFHQTFAAIVSILSFVVLISRFGKFHSIRKLSLYLISQEVFEGVQEYYEQTIKL